MLNSVEGSDGDEDRRLDGGIMAHKSSGWWDDSEHERWMVG